MVVHGDRLYPDIHGLNPYDSIGALAEGVGKLFGAYPPLNREEARKAFGYDPHVGLAEGMRRAVAWYREKGWL